MNVHQTSDRLAIEPPNAIDLEQLVIGAILIERDALGHVSDFLDSEHFYDVRHEFIYAACIELRNAGIAIDIATVTDRLKVNGKLETVGGPFYVSTLTNKIASTANVQHHARIVVQKFMLRSLIRLGSTLQQIDQTNDPFDILDEVNAAVGKINAITTNGDPENAAKLIAEMVDNREQPLQIALGLGPVDECVTMGPGNICVIGARPAVGKTAVAITTARSVALAGHCVAFISLEMSAKQLLARLMSTLTGIDSNRITRNDLDDNDRASLARAAAEHGAWISRIIIDDRATLKSSEVFGLFARLAERHQCKVVIVDYLQLMEGEGQHETAKMSNISKWMKQAAKASGVRLIELSQLRRGKEGDVKPTMSDLRDSGQIEADGDIIVLLSRDIGSTELHVSVAKHKFGPVGDFTIPYDLQTQTIGARVRPPEFSPQIPASVLRSFTESTRMEDEAAPF